MDWLWLGSGCLRAERGARGDADAPVQPVAVAGDDGACGSPRVLKLSAINILTGLLCRSLGAGDGCAAWNYKLLDASGFSVAAESAV